MGQVRAHKLLSESEYAKENVVNYLEEVHHLNQIRPLCVYLYGKK